MEKKRIQTVIDILGKDIGGLVVGFWPKFEHKELMKKLEEEERAMNRRNS